MSRPTSLAPQHLQCPICASDALRLSSPTNFREALRSVVGIRPIRCLKCLHRFGAFAPNLRKLERRKEAVLFQPQAGQSVSLTGLAHLAEIHQIETEWERAIQPTSSLERTYCAQLAQATWHLRCLNQVEREAIAESVRRGSFNGQEAIQVMEWRRSTEASIERALEQIQHYRRTSAVRTQVPAAQPELASLAQALGAGRSRGPIRAMAS